MGHGRPFADRVVFRYHRAGWIPPLIREVATRHARILEVGRGQGIDGLGLCAVMQGGSYVGIDYSVESVRTAQALAADASQRFTFAVKPEFRVASALELPFPDQSVGADFSIGVMHHILVNAGMRRETYRVLRPGGVAYIALYRKYSLKVTTAKLLRGLQAGIDRIAYDDRSIYRRLQRRGPTELSGTMLLECFGCSTATRDPWGFMWLVRARNPCRAGVGSVAQRRRRRASAASAVMACTSSATTASASSGNR